MEESDFENFGDTPNEPEHKKRSSQSLAEKFNNSDKVVIKAQLKEVTVVMDNYGFPLVEVKKAELLVTKGRAAIVHRDTLHGTLISAQETKNTLKKELFTRFEDRFKFTKIAYVKNMPVRDALKLDEARKDTIVGKLEQATQFYTTIFETPEWVIPLNKYSITEGLLEEDFQILNDYKAAIIACDKADNESIEATRLRNISLDKLFDWVKEYKRVALISLKPYPNLLSLLGFN